MAYHYYLFHKPFGCVTARRDERYPTVMDRFGGPPIPDLSPVGRLDRETEGLLLLILLFHVGRSVMGWIKEGFSWLW